jgi:hypothetical protein
MPIGVMERLLVWKNEDVFGFQHIEQFWVGQVDYVPRDAGGIAATDTFTDELISDCV